MLITFLIKRGIIMARLDIDHVYVSSERLEECVINAIEWGLEVSEQVACDLVGGMGITSDELDALGYDENEFPNLHQATM